jgi:hypothetical protein
MRINFDGELPEIKLGTKKAPTQANGARNGAANGGPSKKN